MATPAIQSTAQTLRPPAAATCPECGQAVTHGQTQGLCPVCLFELAQRPPPPDVPPEPLPVFGDYELLEKIDEGGMGVVYRARQRSLNRLVAVKMIRTGRAATESDMHRFRIEAAAAANLDHPNILPVFEFGDHDGLLFYSMKLVEGETLARQIQAGRWLPGAGDAASIQRRLAELMSLLAHAVHHAHQRGVLHRDLKPGNILLDDRGTPYLMDFGLAKLIQSDTELTHTSAVLGTLGYMAPEQVAGNPRLLTPGVDVYGLGAILYALLTGRAPISSEAPFLMLRRAVECDPVPPRQLNPVVDSNFETICLKCLAKDPRRRYASAEALAEDLGHWQRDEPITARPVGVWERGLKWARRHRGPVLGGLAAVVLLALGLSGFVWQRATARQRDELNHLQRAEAWFAEDDAALAVATLARLSRQDPANRVVAERLLNALAQHSFLVPAGPALPAGAHLARWSGNGRRLLLACIESRREAIQLFHGDGQPRVCLQPAPGDTHTADLSPDGRLVAVASEARVRVWDTQVSLQEPILDRTSPTGLVRQVHLLLDRGLLVLAGDRVVRWDLPPGRERREFLGNANLLTQVAVAPDRQWLAAATDTGTLQLWRLDTGERLRSWSNAHQRVIRDLRFSPDGLRLASAAADHTVRLWDPLTGLRLAECRHEQGVHSVEFNPEGDRLLTASRDRTARLWDAATGQPMGQPMRHADSVNTARFSSDGRRVVTTADDGSVRIWDGASGQPLTAKARWAEPVIEAAFRPGGHQVLVRRPTGGVEVRAPTPRQPLWQVSNLLPAPEPALLDAAEHAALSRLHAGTLTCVDLSPDGRLVVTGSSDHTAMVFHRHNRTRLIEPLRHAAPVNCARFSPDGQRIVTSSADRSFRVWDTRTGMPLTDPIATDGPVAQVWFGDEGALVLTDSGRAWSIAQVQEPAPRWLPDLAEAVAGVRLDAQGAPVPVPAEAFVRIAMAVDADPGPLGAWLKPFLGSATETWDDPSPEPP